MKKIWKSESYKKFRDQIFKKRKEIPICTNCSEGLEVEVFEKEAVSEEGIFAANGSAQSKLVTA